MAATLLLLVTLFAPASALERSIPDHRERAHLTDDREIFLEVRVEKGDGWAALRRRYCLPEVDLEALELLQPEGLDPRDEVLLPLAFLSPEWSYRTLTALFPKDTFDGEDWRHIVTHTRRGGGENLYRIALWFTGNAANVEAIQRESRLASTTLERGMELRIPYSLLRRALREHLQPKLAAEVPSVDYPKPGKDDRLTFKFSPEIGEYAEYRLQPGETIYTDVVIRYTGLLLADEVNTLAERIAADSFVHDVTDIKVNFPIRLRTEYIQPDFLYEGHARYQAQREHDAEIASISPGIRRSRDLDGVHIFLDPGHGGQDPGAYVEGVWEHDYCYDIAIRLKEHLERTTRATVYVLLKDQQIGHTIQNQDRLNLNKQEVVMTNPVYFPTNSALSLNLRCFLANYQIAKLRRQGVPPSRIVLLSLHADALHHSVRGTMGYYPDTRYTSESFGKSSDFYDRFAEVRGLNGRVSFPLRERREAEAAGRELGELLLSNLRKAGKPVHPNQPLRGSIVRSSRFVPAILRNTSAGVKLLIETLNLNNASDRKLMTNYRWRQGYAETVAKTLVEFYEEPARASR